MASMSDYIYNESGIQSPSYVSLTNADGSLKSQYSYDPMQSSAFAKEAAIANDPGLSQWATLQQQSNNSATQKQQDLSASRSLGSTNQAMQQMEATGGGSNSGASAFLASQGARNQMMAGQNISSQGAANNLNIAQSDAQNKQQMLGQVASAQTAALAANANTQLTANQSQNAFNANQYNQQMAAWGAQQTANAQTSASRGLK